MWVTKHWLFSNVSCVNCAKTNILDVYQYKFIAARYSMQNQFPYTCQHFSFARVSHALEST